MARKISIQRHVKLVQAAIKRTERYMRNYTKDGPEPDDDMVRMFNDDIKRYQRIIKFLRAGKLKLAFNVMYNMDSSPTVEIWQTYNVLQRWGTK